MSYERITDNPEFDGRCRNSHELRYRVAAGFVEDNDHVIDLGCGTGYGRDIIKTGLYFGVDKNPPKGADFGYYDFEKKELAEPPELGRLYTPDIVVALEIIEHLNERGVDTLTRIAKRAKKWIIVSTPIIPNSNPYHKQNFLIRDIEKLFIDDEWMEYGGLVQADTYGIFIFKNKKYDSAKID